MENQSMAVLILLFCAIVVVAAVVIGLPWLITQAWLLARQIAAGVPDRGGEIAAIEAEFAERRAREHRATEEGIARDLAERAVADREAAEALVAEDRNPTPRPAWTPPGYCRGGGGGGGGGSGARRAVQPMKVEPLTPPKNYNPDKYDDRGGWLGADDRMHHPDPKDLPRLRAEYAAHRALSRARIDRDRAAINRRIETARGR